jgi:hypothetical protein
MRSLGAVEQGGLIVQPLGIPASIPHATTPVLVIQAVSLSGITPLRSRLPSVVEFPGHDPPFEFAASIRVFDGSRRLRISSEFPISPVKIWSAAISETAVSSVRSRRKYPPAGKIPVRAILGVPSTPLNTHPVKLISADPGLYNSIHSSLVEASVPAQATSLMRSVRGGTAVPAGEEVAVLVGEGVFVEDDVGDGV